jgi:mono/diheme cytochrome c family protein
VLPLALAAALAACSAGGQSQVERGKYLVSVIGCTDCHTPGGLSPKPDLTRFLAGSDVGFSLPDLGYFVGPNLTSDKATGLGSWTNEQIVTALTTGVRPDGRVLAPSMPVQDLKNLTKSDAEAIAAYLKSLPPISRKVPGPGAAKPCGAAVICMVPW